MSMGWSLEPPSGYMHIRLEDMQRCRCEDNYHYFDAKALGDMLSGMSSSDVSIPGERITFDEALSLVAKLAQKEYEKDVLSGNVQVSKREADEIMRYGSQDLKDVVKSMKGRYGVDAGGFCSSCVA